MHFAILFAFIPITRVFADFRLTHHEENTVTLFCQLVAPEGTTFQYIIPYITRDNDTQELEFRDIQNNMDDSRYFGIQFPDISSKNLIGIIVIRSFRDSDLQNNFKCSQSLFNGTLIEYSLTIDVTGTTDPNNSSTTKEIVLISLALFISIAISLVLLIFLLSCPNVIVNRIKSGFTKLRKHFRNTQTNSEPPITLQALTPLSDRAKGPEITPLHTQPQGVPIGSKEEQDSIEPNLFQRSLSKENALNKSDGKN